MSNMYLDKITIVVPTYNRYKYLKRVLQYYNSFEYKLNIFIADSSSQNINDYELSSTLKKDNVNYFKFPEDIRVEKKILEAIKKVNTKYITFCADDDFVIPGGIEESIRFLETNWDYSCAHGIYLVYELEKGKNGGIRIHWNLANSGESIEFDKPEVRLSQHLDNYTSTFYAVHRTNQLRFLFDETIKLTSDYRFGELIPSALTAILGKIKVLDVLYCCREFSAASTSQSGYTWHDVMMSNSYQNKYDIIRKSLAVHLSPNSHIALRNAEKEVDRVLKKYLIKTVGGNFFLRMNCELYDKFYKISRTISNKLGLFRLTKFLARNFHRLKKKTKSKTNTVPFDFGSPSSEYYKDFVKIKNCILRNPCRN